MTTKTSTDRLASTLKPSLLRILAVCLSAALVFGSMTGSVVAADNSQEASTDSRLSNYQAQWGYDNWQDNRQSGDSRVGQYQRGERQTQTTDQKMRLNNRQTQVGYENAQQNDQDATQESAGVQEGSDNTQRASQDTGQRSDSTQVGYRNSHSSSQSGTQSQGQFQYSR
jgi:hypothetical protein